MSDVGRPTELDDALLLKIEGLVMQGKNLKEIAEECEISYKTMEGWVSRNYEGFRDKLKMYKNEWRLSLAEQNIDEALQLKITNPVIVSGVPQRNSDGTLMEVIDPKLIRIKIDNSHFVAETLGKDTYSKRQELVGKGGGSLVAKEDVQEVVARLKAAAGLPDNATTHEIKPESNNGSESVNTGQPVASS